MKRLLFLIIVLLFTMACQKKQPEIAPDHLNFMVYSNPATESFVISVQNDANESGKIVVFDTDSKIFLERTLQEGANSVHVNLAQSPIGIYTVILSTTKGNYSKNVIKY